MKRPLKIILSIVGFLLVLALAFNAWLERKYVVPILMYHSIDRPSRFSGIVISPESFRKQLAYLKEHQYTVLSFDELVTTLKGNRHPPRHSVVITFDDGYEDNYTQAFPILKEFGYPASIFMITDLIGKKGYLNWDQMREMEKFKISFGGHTASHVYLPGVPEEIQTQQIFDCKKALEKNLGHRIDYFAYPSGGFTDGTKDILKEAGFQVACTTNRGTDRFNKDLYELKRVRFKNSDIAISMWAKLSGYYNLFRVLKEPN